jgi:ADP-ribose pyrophosphatase
MIKPWQKIRSELLGDYRIFRLRSDRVVSPRTGTEHDFYVIDSVNWVNVIALTSDRQLVMVEQYRHGTNTVELEVPGGMMEDAESSPTATGMRELREETGYEGESPLVIGRVFPNPAIMSNTCFTVMFSNCRLKHPVDFDHGEDLSTCLIAAADVPLLVAQGKIRHSLVVAALYHLELWQRGLEKRSPETASV